MARDFDAIMPEGVRALPRDHRGYPVPFFVQWFGGRPDFRVMDPDAFKAAVSRRLCWVCGRPFLSRRCAFVGGPLVVGQRMSAEPPSHIECAEFSAKACPFLAFPEARRREADKPDHGSLAGIQIEENPGVAAVLVTRSFRPEATPTGPMFRIGDPERVLWFRQGRPAAPAEVESAVEIAMARYARAAGPRGDAHAKEIRQRLSAALPSPEAPSGRP